MLEGNGFSYFSVAENLNSKSGYLFNLLMDQISGESEFRDTLIEHAAGFRVFFIYGYGMTKPDQVASGGKSSNARADDSDGFPGGGEERVKKHRIGLFLIGSTSLGGTNGNGIAKPFVAVAAGRFTRAGADAA